MANSKLEKAFNRLGYSIDDLLRECRNTPVDIKAKLNPHFSQIAHLKKKRINLNIMAKPKLTLATIQRLYEDNIKKYGTLTCYLCEYPVAFGDDSIDHKVPIFKGGTNVFNNLGITHKTCNSSKGLGVWDGVSILR